MDGTKEQHRESYPRHRFRFSLSFTVFRWQYFFFWKMGGSKVRVGRFWFSDFLFFINFFLGFDSNTFTNSNCFINLQYKPYDRILSQVREREFTRGWKNAVETSLLKNMYLFQTITMLTVEITHTSNRYILKKFLQTLVI